MSRLYRTDGTVLYDSASADDERQALIELLDAHTKDLRRANLAGLDLSGLTLEDVDLSGSDLSGAYCARATFCKVLLHDVHADRTIFAGAQFRYINSHGFEAPRGQFTGAGFFRCYFNDFTAHEASFAEAQLRRTSIVNSDFEAADLTDAVLKEQVHLSNVNLAHTHLDRLEICGDEESHCVVELCRLRGSKADELRAHLVRFSQTSFEDAEWTVLYATECVFPEAMQVNAHGVKFALASMGNQFEAGSEGHEVDQIVALLRRIETMLIETERNHVQYAGSIYMVPTLPGGKLESGDPSSGFPSVPRLAFSLSHGHLVFTVVGENCSVAKRDFPCPLRDAVSLEFIRRHASAEDLRHVLRVIATEPQIVQPVINRTLVRRDNLGRPLEFRVYVNNYAPSDAFPMVVTSIAKADAQLSTFMAAPSRIRDERDLEKIYTATLGLPCPDGLQPFTHEIGHILITERECIAIEAAVGRHPTLVEEATKEMEGKKLFF